jgi:hypothetical protein
MMGMLLVSIPAAAEPLVGARFGAHVTEEDGQTSLGPLAEIEAGVLRHGVALTGFLRVDRRGLVDHGTHSCAEVGPWSMMQCPWTTTTEQTDVALGMRARARVGRRLWFGATAGGLRVFESTHCVGSEGACSDDSSSHDGLFGETSLAYAVPVQDATIEVMLDIGYAYFGGSDYAYAPSNNAKWFGLSVGVRR